jgi:hypothetical protein
MLHFLESLLSVCGNIQKGHIYALQLAVAMILNNNAACRLLLLVVVAAYNGLTNDLYMQVYKNTHCYWVTVGGAEGVA